MRRAVVLIVALGALGGLGAVGAPTRTAHADDAPAAPTPPTAQEVLARAEQATELAARFRERITDASTGAVQVRTGSVLAARGRLRVDEQARRSGRDVVVRSHVFDGAAAWTIDHVQRAISTAPAPDPGWAATLAVVARPGLAARYDVTFEAPATADAYVLRLVPRQRDAITRLVLVVDTASARVAEATVTEASGRTRHVRFTADARLAAKPRAFVVHPTALRGYTFVPAPAAPPAAPPTTPAPHTPAPRP